MFNERKRNLRELEKTVLAKHKDKRENEVVLEHDDFKDGKLSWNGFRRLRDECEYIDYKDDIEIKVPAQYADSFKDTVELMATNELLHIKKDIRDMRIAALLFFLVGVAVLAIGLSIQSPIRQELFIIVSWVFIWAASEKIFFDRSNLKDSRYNLLHILSAKVQEIAEETKDESEVISEKKYTQKN